MSRIVIGNPWSRLRQFTPARIALGRSGISLPTKPHLEFQLAHARARNAVHHELNVQSLESALRERGLAFLTLHSAAENRSVYLQRPDKGRSLDSGSRAILEAEAQLESPPGAVFVICDGLSALAIEENVMTFLDVILPALKAGDWRIGPIAITRQARVAIGDEVGELLKAELAVVLIGERPGLSSPDSMGIYMTHKPRTGLTDESRNCISNVRKEGLSYEHAAHKLMYLMSEARKRGHSGVLLKDEAEALPRAVSGSGVNFLTSDE